MRAHAWPIATVKDSPCVLEHAPAGWCPLIRSIIMSGFVLQQEKVVVYPATTQTKEIHSPSKNRKQKKACVLLENDFGSMLRQEWPTMIYKLPLKNIGVTRYYKVDHKEVCFQQESNSYHELMAYNKLFNQDVDIMQPLDNNQVTYMNTVQSLGDPITTV